MSPKFRWSQKTKTKSKQGKLDNPILLSIFFIHNSLKKKKILMISKTIETYSVKQQEKNLKNNITAFQTWSFHFDNWCKKLFSVPRKNIILLLSRKS